MRKLFIITALLLFAGIAFGQTLKKGGMADMITAKMSKKKKGKMMKGKR